MRRDSNRKLPKLLAALTAACTAVTAGAAAAADAQYPARPIRLVVTAAAGGGLDVLARIVTPRLSEAMGQQWVIDNRGGASGVVGTDIVAKAPPDGYTAALVLSVQLVANPWLYRPLPFSVEKDLQPVTKLAASDYLLVVHPSVQAASVKDLVALAKAQPRKLNYSSAGVGSSGHLATEMFKHRAGVDLVHVAYKGGGPATAAVLANEVQVIFVSAGAVVAQIGAGRLKALAVTGSKRSPVLPELPTVAESGFPGFDVSGWYGVVLPAKTPAAIVKRLYDEGLLAVKQPNVQQALARQGQEVVTSSSPQAFAAEIKRETAEWGTVIKAAGIKPE